VISGARGRPLVLLANDDGYRARGIERMRAALEGFADVVVCAPEAEQSATSHSLSLHRPLRLFQHGPGVFSVDGTPADCVYVALHAGTRVVPRRPDLVVSGLNHGVNLGDDVFYSGTVAAAREGALKGLRALAVSAAHDADLDAAARVSAQIAELILNQPIEPLLLNVNFPRGSAWPVRATRLGTRVYTDGVEFRRDPRGREYLWLGGPGGVQHREAPGSDTEAYDQGVVGVTPLVLDLWAHAQQESAEVVARTLGTNLGGVETE
jgi:5'-nucleotidase